MERYEAAILRTVLYADVFDFPLTIDELHRYLISDVPLSVAEIKILLDQSSKLCELLYRDNGYVCLAQRVDLIAIRQQREKITRTLWLDAIRYGRWLSYIPFVEMVSLTGALAVRNPTSEDDDYDYLLITQPKRVWLARAFAILLVRIVRLMGHEICPNYVLASDQLIQARQDLYTAHEVSQMRPIYGTELYQQIFEQNEWVQIYLPNVTTYPMGKDAPRRVRRVFEWLLGGWFGDMLENWEYQRKVVKFRSKMKQPQSSAEIGEGQIKGHFKDHGLPVMMRYERLLEDYGLMQTQQAMVGD